MARKWWENALDVLTGGMYSIGSGVVQIVKNIKDNPVDAWDEFLHGTTNEDNKEINKDTNETNKQNVQDTNDTNKKIAEDTNKANKLIAEDTNRTNKLIAEDTNTKNYEVAQQNLAFQKEQQEYEEALQQQIFEREDTSYQRTVEDMKKAGISPLAMQGTNGSGSIISRTPSNNQMQYQGYEAKPYEMKPYQMTPFQAVPYTVQKSGLADALPILQSFITLGQENQMKQAQIQNIKAQTEATKVKTLFDNNTLDERQKAIVTDNLLKNLNLNKGNYDFNNQKMADNFLLNMGILPSLPEQIKNVGFLYGGNMFQHNGENYEYKNHTLNGKEFKFTPDKDFVKKLNTVEFLNALKTGMGLLGGLPH